MRRSLMSVAKDKDGEFVIEVPQLTFSRAAVTICKCEENKLHLVNVRRTEGLTRVFIQLNFGNLQRDQTEPVNICNDKPLTQEC